MFFQSCLPGLAGRCGGNEDDENGNNSNIRSVLKMDPSTGALKIPSYTQISRAEHCPLLKHAWGQNWQEVVNLCASQPWRSLHMTKYSKRTALHLATFDRRCPLQVARALLKANRHMIAVRDSNNYTPLHIVAFFSAATTIAQGANTASNETESPAGNAVATNRMGRTLEDGMDERAAAGTTPLPQGTSRANVTNAMDAEAETMSVVSVFCDTAIMVEQELGRALGKEEEPQLPLLEGTSPLYLAAKKGAPVSILKILLETRSRTNWIAPTTGGEPYWYGNTNGQQNTSFSSPLEILLREDRLRSTMNASYYRNDVYLLGEEEDGNLLRRGRTRTSDPSSSSSAAASRLGEESTRARRSALHPDEIQGVPHLIREMRRMAIDRCHEHYCRKECGIENQGDDLPSDGPNGDSSSIAKPANFTPSQQRCLELWEKCVELLVTAGGGGVPLLLEEEDQTMDEKAIKTPTTNHCDSSSFVPYGILHACVCCKVPIPSLVEISLILFPEQASKREAIYGLTPLHHVLRTKHKYSFATSNLLTILLRGKTRVTIPLPSATTGETKKKKKTKKRSFTNAATVLPSRNGRMPELPSLSDFPTFTDVSDKIILSPFQRSNLKYLQSTVLLPFPCMTNDYIVKRLEEQPMQEHNGPLPLIFAIRLGLPMNGVIDRLLEADSHESLRTIDPISRLPPFALVAIRVRPIPRIGKLSDYRENPYEAAMTTTTTTRRHDHSNDIITAAIGSTINVLSSGDGSSQSASATFSSNSSNFTSSKHPKVDLKSIYKLDDVYRLLLAHPQVLSQYIDE